MARHLLFGSNGGGSQSQYEDTTMDQPRYDGTPEHYLRVPPTSEIDIDALNCALNRAQAVTAMLGLQFHEDNETLCRPLIAAGFWALQGLLEQAEIIIRRRP